MDFEQSLLSGWLCHMTVPPLVIPCLESYLNLCKYKISSCGDRGAGWARPGRVGAGSLLRDKEVCRNEREEMKSIQWIKSMKPCLGPNQRKQMKQESEKFKTSNGQGDPECSELNPGPEEKEGNAHLDRSPKICGR